jgi:hypothetical protein
MLAVCGQLCAQTGPPPGAGPPGSINPKVEDRQQRTAEQGLRLVEMGTLPVGENHDRVHATVRNLKEDFSRIQVVRNDIAGNLVARKPLDYKLVMHQTTEINKRAKELKSYLMFHAAADKKDSEALASEEMVGALVRLCKLIDRFTENPALKSAAIVDVNDVDKLREHRNQAERDLMAIIKLSESIQAESARLKGSH